MAARIKNATQIQAPAAERSHGKFGIALRKTVLRPVSCTILAAIGIFGGISSLFVGLACVVIHALVTGDAVFDRVGTVLLVAAIPLILVGSVFLDEINTHRNL